MLVKEYMSTDLYVIKKNETIQKANSIFENNSFRHLPVVEDGKVLGVISDRDINRSLAISVCVSDLCGAEVAEEMRVDSIMTKDFLSISPDEMMKRAAEIMIEKKIGCLPVIDNDVLVGIITETDILKRFVGICE